MKEYLSEIAVPTEKVEFEKIIVYAFETLTNHSINEEHFYLERFSHGGMSSGLISTQYWRETVILFLWLANMGEDPQQIFIYDYKSNKQLSTRV